jgi:hypothetical protein
LAAHFLNLMQGGNGLATGGAFMLHVTAHSTEDETPMSLIRTLACLAALCLVAPAQAEAASLAKPAGGLFFPASRGSCPRLCVEWFNGCTTCSCGRGRINVCTPQPCFWRGRARCLRWGF